MDKNLLSEEELNALNAASTNTGSAADFWLLKNHIVFLVTAAMGIFCLAFPQELIQWLRLDSLADQENIRQLLQIRAISIASALIVGYFGYTYSRQIRLILGILLSIVIMDSALDIPVFYLEKIAAKDIDIAVMIVLRAVLIYCLASLFRRAEYLPPPKRKFFINPFKRDPNWLEPSLQVGEVTDEARK